MRPTVREYWAWKNFIVGSEIVNISTQEQAENIIFEAGKKYLFESGKKYDVSYDVDVENVTIGSYGSGLLPELRASEDISTLTWTDNAGIWSTPMVENPKWIYINDAVAKWAETDWIQIIDRPALNSLTADTTTLNAFSDIVGATMVAKDQPWRIASERTVTAYSNGTITFTPDLVATADDRLGFKLYNKVEFIVDNNEWAWEDGVLYVKSTVSPALLDIRKSSGDYIIKASAPGLTIETVRLNQSYSYNIKIESDNVSILNCEISNSRGCGVLAQQKYSGINVSYNIVEDCALNGISIGPATSPVIRRNTVRNIGMGENYGWQNYSYGTNTQVVGAGIASYIDPLSSADVCENALIEYNHVSNCGYNGIGLHAQQNAIIRKNIVHNYMNRYTDGGGIYLVHYRGHDVLGIGAIVEDNIVYDSNVGLGGYYESDGFSGGVYIDNRVINTIIRRNTIYDIYKAGININWDKKHTQSLENIIFNCAYGLRYLRGGIDVIVTPDNEENILNDNIIIAKDESQILLYVVDTNAQGIYNPFAGGEGDNNKYVQPYTDLIGFREDDPNNPDGREVFMTLADIRSRFAIDANSTAKVDYKATPEEGDVILYTNETDVSVNQLIPEGYEDVDGVDVSGQTLSIPAYGGLAVTKTVVAATYPTWSNTQSMVVDATGEGVQVIDSNLYPSNGSSDDKAITTEIIHKTPGTINSSILFFSKDSTLSSGFVVVGVTSTGDVYITLQINTSNRITFSPTVAAPLVANTWYHIVHTYDGNQDSPSVTLKINNTVHAVSPVETGNYTGLPDLIGDYLIELPRNGGASYGDGYYNLLRMFNRVLTASEITDLYNARVTGGLTGLNDLIEACQLELRFEGDASADIGTNGTLVGSPSFIAETP